MLKLHISLNPQDNPGVIRSSPFLDKRSNRSTIQEFAQGHPGLSLQTWHLCSQVHTPGKPLTIPDSAGFALKNLRVQCAWGPGRHYLHRATRSFTPGIISTGIIKLPREEGGTCFTDRKIKDQECSELPQGHRDSVAPGLPPPLWHQTCRAPGAEAKPREPDKSQTPRQSLSVVACQILSASPLLSFFAPTWLPGGLALIWNFYF